MPTTKALMPCVLSLLLLVAWTVPAGAWICAYKKAISGDTCIVTCDGNDAVVRLYGIDAPDIGQMEHDRSRDQLDTLLRGDDATLIGQGVAGGTPDRYGRYQVVLYKNGHCVNERMVALGMAFVSPPEQCRIGACVGWRAAETSARLWREGIWFAAGEDKPWNFRAGLRQLAGRRGGYFEDIQYVRQGRFVRAFEPGETTPDWSAGRLIGPSVKPGL